MTSETGPFKESVSTDTLSVTASVGTQNACYEQDNLSREERMMTWVLNPACDTDSSASCSAVTEGNALRRNVREISVHREEQDFRATEAFAANSDDVAVWELVGLWVGTALPYNRSVWRQD